ncbi:hypothetical protein BLA60_15200 [Actinophytocola xinjiangensis]|uniref:Thioesterase domain-containing protein n=1 Tax=Actinophytocola xinjiangensis TaxID=485602 RepID=A0A7Z0WLX7_9PSEU|nr:alpha/beta fold hydrolase [Actinophytocola xinjiangensis]OLF10528.1 hypothetical protein BLA60_15200 [Actinophytocola xinjiangensis]
MTRTSTTTALVCLPFAGGGAAFFRQWAATVPAGFTVLAVQPPGREERFVESPHTEVAAVVDEACGWVLPRLDGADRVVLFGHSLGALLAFELARELSRRSPVPLARLVVSGAPGPWQPRADGITGLNDDEFLARVEGLVGYVHEALRMEEMREVLLPVLRADVQMRENYQAEPDARLDVPVTALRGRDDDLVDAASCRQWSAATTAEFRLVEVDGGHMYLAERPDLLRDALVELLDDRPVRGVE